MYSHLCCVETFERDRTKCTLGFNIICTVVSFCSFENALYQGKWSRRKQRHPMLIDEISTPHDRRTSCADQWNTLKSGYALDSLSTDSGWSLLLPVAMWILPTDLDTSAALNGITCPPSVTPSPMLRAPKGVTTYESLELRSQPPDEGKIDPYAILQAWPRVC